MVTVVLPEVFTVVLGTEQVTLADKLDATEQEKDTVPLKFFIGATVMVELPDVPGATWRVAGLAVI